MSKYLFEEKKVIMSLLIRIWLHNCVEGRGGQEELLQLLTEKEKPLKVRRARRDHLFRSPNLIIEYSDLNSWEGSPDPTIESDHWI